MVMTGIWNHQDSMTIFSGFFLILELLGFHACSPAKWRTRLEMEADRLRGAIQVRRDPKYQATQVARSLEA